MLKYMHDKFDEVNKKLRPKLLYPSPIHYDQPPDDEIFDLSLSKLIITYYISFTCYIFHHIFSKNMNAVKRSL